MVDTVTDRDQLIDAFVASSAFAGAPRIKLPGDASTRRYERLAFNDRSYFLMDAPPVDGAICLPNMGDAERKQLGYIAAARLASGRVSAFVTIDAYLRDIGLSAPEIFAADDDKGLAIIDDFGDQQYYAWLQTGQAPEQEIYKAAIDVLVQLHKHTPPDTLQARGMSWKLFSFDKTVIDVESDIFVEWYCQKFVGLSLDAQAVEAFNTVLNDMVAPVLARQDVLTLRDFHSPNLMWREGQQGVQRVGLIDFQDALRGPKAYDLVSLLQDARRDVSPELEREMLAYYITQSGIADADQLLADYAIIGAQRNIRLVGLWPRLKLRDNKPNYMQHMPRVVRYLERNLQHPACAPLKAWFDHYLPGFAEKAVA